MLVLTRKLGEEIVIGQAIRLKVLAVRRNQIRIGIDAPPEVAICRQEIVDRDRASRHAEHADFAEGELILK